MKKLYGLFLWAILFLTINARSQQDNTMFAHFINVGQADATLLEFPCGAILIDAGAQSEVYERKLITYLKKFFARRTDLNNTLDLVIVTHPHLDHNLALDNVAEKFTIKKYIDNGLREGSGKTNQNWLQDNSKRLGITYAKYPTSKIMRNNNSKGITDTLIDPIDCEGIDPKIMLLHGSYARKPAGWSVSDFNNGNNHSVVVKVSFGKASFLFTGDLEESGIEKLLDIYDEEVLDIDILRVGHHGSHNATTKEFLEATTPSSAIISCGKWNYGSSGGKFNTYSYGHPRIVVLDLLEENIPDNRETPITIKAGIKSKQFKNYTVTKSIYATPWDKTIQIEADSEGNYRVIKNN